MTDNNLTIAELQAKINTRLEKHNGAPYESTNYHGLYGIEIDRVFAEEDIEIFRTTTWRIVADFKESGLSSLWEDVAEVKVELNRDKRYKYGSGRGKIISMAVQFREELLPLTIDGARLFLLEEKRAGRIAFKEEQRDNALAIAKAAEEEIAHLKALTFSAAEGAAQ